MAESLDDKHDTSDEYSDTCFEGKGLNIKVHGYCEDCLDEQHGVCDWYNDPFCDPCFESKGFNIKVHSYCKDCFQFLCLECHVIHVQLQTCRHHVFLQGASMPQSQADKPPKFEYCNKHPELVKDRFCSSHKTLICSSCASDHRKCVIETVADVCKTVNSYETDLLYDTVKALHDQAKSVVMAVHLNMKEVSKQKEQMLKEAKELHDTVISKVNKLLLDMQSEIEAAYQTQTVILSQQKDKMNDLVSRFESSLNDIEKFRGKSVDTKMFLEIQGSVTDTNQITDEFVGFNKSLLLKELAFVPNKTIDDFLSATFTLGSLTKTGIDIVVTGKPMLFPRSVPMKAIKKAIRTSTDMVREMEDKYSCCVDGLAVAKNGRKLMSDSNNKKVKMFSRDMQCLSSVSVPGKPRDIAMISEREAIVTTDNNSLVILDISDCQLSIKTTTQLSYNVHGISRYNNKLVVTSPPAVKLIDQTGRVYWSVSSDQQGKPLFIWPLYVSSHGDGRSSTVIVTDCSGNTLTLLNGNTGEVITRRQLERKSEPRGVTTDPHGNIYVCYHRTEEVAVLSADLSEEKILLRTKFSLTTPFDQFFEPVAIVYDNITHKLIVSNSLFGTVHFYKLS